MSQGGHTVMGVIPSFHEVVDVVRLYPRHLAKVVELGAYV
jgi:hypothetical protein